MTKPGITIRHFRHKGENQIALQFDYNRELIDIAKKIDGMQWSQSHKCWYIQNNPGNLKKLFASFKDFAHIDKGDFFNKDPESKIIIKKEKSATEPPGKPVPEEYINLLKRRRYSENTIRTYQHCFYQFINHYPDISLEDLTEEHISKYQDYLVNKKKVSLSTQNQAINSIKFYYEHVLRGERKSYYIERPRKEKKLPDVLSKVQVKHLLKSTTNLKHKTILGMLYSAGLRNGEVINLRTRDVLWDRNMIMIKGAKGKKDRTGLLSENMKIVLKAYLAKYKPTYWLFESPDGKKYSQSSVRKVFKNSLRMINL
jgi:site-specific recombinase XerD